MVPGLRPPGHFASARAQAQKLWDQLEANPELRGPWEQLFQQVTNSPDHVISELLQNADDAGATEASLELNDEAFVLSHNGKDFTPSDFAALCSFGNSNKSSLLTIGFRGIGFKSAFAVGPRVKLRTPTLSVVFNQRRFTLPEWEEMDSSTLGTTVRIPLAKAGMRTRLTGYLQVWRDAPLSLLFFRNLRALRINGELVHFRSVGAGPVLDSEWFQVDGSERPLLLLRSQAAPFPDDALEEIRTTRGDPNLTLPPVSVQIVLGDDAAGRLHVVLPTGIRTALPFACNGPFLQDPARTAIKDPLLSPTNQWLLSRIGQLAGESLVHWVGNTSASVEERVVAYGLLPSADIWQGDPVSDVIVQAENAALVDQAFTLCSDGSVNLGAQVVLAVPLVRAVWPPETLCVISGIGKHAVHETVSEDYCRRLTRVGGGTLWTEDDLIQRLHQPMPVPRPSQEGLRALWDLCSTYVRRWGHKLSLNPETVAIIPAYASDRLHRAGQVIRLGDVGDQLSQADLAFLSSIVPTVDLGFAMFGADQVHRSTYRLVLSELGLNNPVGAQQLLHRVAEVLRQRDDREGLLRVGRIAGLADVALEPSFPLITRSGALKNVSDGVLGLGVDELEDFFPGQWLHTRRISDDYLDGLTNDEIQRWSAWAETGRAGLPRFPLPEPHEVRLYGSEVSAWAAVAGLRLPEKLHLKHGDWRATNWEHDAVLLSHWKELARERSDVYGIVAREVLAFPVQLLDACAADDLRQHGYSKSYHVLSRPASWLRWLAAHRSLPDDRGEWRYPAELLLSSPATEPLRGIEPFLATDLDRPEVHALLRTLGVRDMPTDVEGILQRLRASAAVPAADAEVVVTLFRCLDRIWDLLPSEAAQAAVAALAAEPLLLSSHSTWHRSGEVCRSNPMELPAVVTVHPALTSLAFLKSCGVPQEPGPEHVLGWLQSRRGKVLAPGEVTLARRALTYLGAKGLKETGTLLTLSGELRDIAQVQYLIRDDRDAPILFEPFNRVVAILPPDPAWVSAVAERKPIPWLDDVIEERISARTIATLAARPKWLHHLSTTLAAFAADARFADDIESLSHIAHATWEVGEALLVELWADAKHLGPPQEAQAAWHGRRIVVVGRRKAYEPALARALERRFSHPLLRQVVGRAVGRDSEFINELLEELGAPQADDAQVLIQEAKVEARPLALGDDRTLEPGEPEAASPSQDSPPDAREKSEPVSRGSAASATVAVLGAGSGLSGAGRRSPRATDTGTPSARRGASWVGVARGWLRAEGFERTRAGKRSEEWRHPNGRWAQLGRLPVHIWVYEADGLPGASIHVCLLRGKHANRFPLLHQTWESLMSAGKQGFLLLVERDSQRLVPFAAVVESGQSFPSAYMVRLPDSLMGGAAPADNG